MKIFKRLLALTLVVGFIVVSSLKEPEFVPVDAYSSRRDNGDGTFTTVIRMRPVNEQISGVWVPIDRNHAGTAYADSTTACPDPSPETSSVDGYTHYDHATYSTAHDAADGSSINDSGGDVEVEHSRNGTPVYWISRGNLTFPTASIPDDHVPSAATITVTGKAKADAIGDSVRLVTANPASDTALATADYDQYGTTALANYFTISAFDSAGANVFTLVAAGIANINVTGVSEFGVRLLRDVDNSAPTGTNYVVFASADTVGTGSDPVLVVTHAAGAAAAEPARQTKSISIF